MRDYVLFFVNGRRHEVRGEQVFRPLSEYLREELGLPGTKVVCAEGDCGSCTVLLGRPAGGRIDYRPVTSCIQYVAQLDGAHVITVEGLAYDGKLNPVQRAMVDHHGAQCGFCTPGFVTAMCGLFDAQSHPGRAHPGRAQPAREEVQRALVGNLCRCTGYDSILAAAKHVDGTAMRPLGELYAEAELRPVLERAAAESITVTDGSRTIYKPATLAEAVKLRSAHPQAIVLAGGTDLGVVWNKKKSRPADLICLGDLAELRRSRVAGGVWTIGAAVSLADLEREAAKHLPSYAAMLDRFGSPPIKNAGTLGGNLVNGSPIGDTIPALLVLNAEAEIAGPKGSRRVNLNEFYAGYRRTVLGPDELLAAVHVPLPKDDEVLACYKVSKRRDLDISSFTAAVWMRAEGETIGAARVAYGGVAATVVRLPQTEGALVGQPLTEASWRKAGRTARGEIKPISDVRGSAEYRATLAQNILVKFGREHGGSLAAATNGHP
jgi:xanthine dehydrogenase small subunit